MPTFIEKQMTLFFYGNIFCGFPPPRIFPPKVKNSKDLFSVEQIPGGGECCFKKKERQIFYVRACNYRTPICGCRAAAAARGSSRRYFCKIPQSKEKLEKHFNLKKSVLTKINYRNCVSPPSNSFQSLNPSTRNWPLAFLAFCRDPLPGHVIYGRSLT